METRLRRFPIRILRGLSRGYRAFRGEMRKQSTASIHRRLSQMTELKAKLEYTTVDGWLRTLELTDEYLTSRWEKGKRNRCNHIALDKLCPEPSYLTARPMYNTAIPVGGLFLVALSAVCYFSAVQEIVPSLSFVLCVFGVAALMHFVKHMRLETWTIIRDDLGGVVTDIVHRGCDDAEREQFVKECQKAITLRKQRNQQQDEPDS